MLTFSGDLATIMTLGFYLASIMYVVFTVILYYHWMEYAMDERVRTLSLAIYFIISLPLLLLMGAMIFLA